MDLNERVALVTGGARMGADIGEFLAKKGCDVCFTYRNSRKAALADVKVVQRQGRRSIAVHADMSQTSNVKRAIGTVIKQFGRLDILVNMASVYFETPWKELNEKNWNSMMDANLKSVYLSVLAAAPYLKRSKGRVVNVTDWLSVSGRPRYKNFVPYYTAKTGVLGLTQAQALEMAPHVLVNAIAPGPILPPSKISKAQVNEVKKSTPLGRWGGAKEIAKAVVFLCETDFVTGESIRVDGGRHLY